MHRKIRPVAWLILLSIVVSGVAARGADTRVDFLKLIDRPRVALEPQVMEPTTKDGTTEVRFSFASEVSQRVPGIMLSGSSSQSRRPVVIVLHGTGGTKEGELPLMRDLVAKGFAAVAIDGRYHGQRTKSGKGSAEYQDAILRAWRDPGHEHPFYFDTAWDVMRLIDYLQTRDDIDAKRIGLIGISKGGIETWLSAAVDPRVGVAVPCIGVQSFKWALDNDAWRARIGTIQKAFDSAVKDAGIATPDAAFVHQFYEHVCPGIDGEFDGPSMLPLIAPRPLLVINGETDDRNPLPGLKLCTDAAEQAYHAAGADDHFVVRIEVKTGHKVTPESQREAIDWFARWLKP